MFNYLQGLQAGERVYEFLPAHFNDMSSKELEKQIDTVYKPLLTTRSDDYWKGYKDAIEHFKKNKFLKVKSSGMLI